LQEIASLRNQVLETRTDLSAAIERAAPAPADNANEVLALAELRALREQLTAEQEATRQRQTQEHEALAQRAAQFEFERDELRRQLQAQLELAQAAVAAEDDEAPLAALLEEITSLRNHVLETRTDLSAAIERNAQVPALVASENGVDRAASEQLAELAQEKAELENELELVRTRAAELHETVAEQKNQLREERSVTTTELKELRRLVEQQAELLAQLEPPENVRNSMPAPRISIPSKAPAPSTTNTVAASAAAEEAEPADPVVNSVMAQFAKLQKDVAQRRKKK
jgi:chromosome segregation ATPase